MINKKISLIAVLLGLLFISSACGDDNNDNEVSEEWKVYQRNLVTKVKEMKDESGNKVYEEIKSVSYMGSIYVKDSEFITKGIEQGIFDKNEPNLNLFPKTKATGTDRPNYDSDVVRVRYEGWYYTESDVKAIFNSTERNLSTGEWLNNVSNGVDFSVGGVVDGFRTLLQNMKVGEEKIVCIPYQMGYGTESQYDSYTGAVTIPAYTTLFFDVKLLRNLTAEEEQNN